MGREIIEVLTKDEKTGNIKKYKKQKEDEDLNELDDDSKV